MTRRSKFTTMLWALWALCASHTLKADTRERYAALECQDQGAFVLLNFYPDQTYQLTWGRDDKITQEDVKVNRLYSVGVEVYAGENLRLSLPIGGGETSTVPRIAEFQAIHPTPVIWRTLRCFLYGAD